LISDELLQKNEGEIRANRCGTIREVHHIIPEVSKTTIHEAFTEKSVYRKLCARRVHKMLSQFETEKFKSDVLHHPPCSPDLALSDLHLFLHLKKHLAGKKVEDDDEVQEEALTWFKWQAADRSWFQDLINVWTMPANTLKNKAL
jgi:hypothetical protein